MLGRAETTAESGSMSLAYQKAAATAGFSLRDLMATLIQSKAFMYRLPSARRGALVCRSSNRESRQIGCCSRRFCHVALLCGCPSSGGGDQTTGAGGQTASVTGGNGTAGNSGSGGADGISTGGNGAAGATGSGAAIVSGTGGMAPRALREMGAAVEPHRAPVGMAAEACTGTGGHGGGRGRRGWDQRRRQGSVRVARRRRRAGGNAGMRRPSARRASAQAALSSPAGVRRGRPRWGFRRPARGTTSKATFRTARTPCSASTSCTPTRRDRREPPRSRASSCFTAAAGPTTSRPRSRRACRASSAGSSNTDSSFATSSTGWPTGRRTAPSLGADRDALLAAKWFWDHIDHYHVDKTRYVTDGCVSGRSWPSWLGWPPPRPSSDRPAPPTTRLPPSSTATPVGRDRSLARTSPSLCSRSPATPRTGPPSPSRSAPSPTFARTSRRSSPFKATWTPRSHEREPGALPFADRRGRRHRAALRRRCRPRVHHARHRRPDAEAAMFNFLVAHGIGK